MGKAEAGLGSLGQDQLTWLQKDLAGLADSTPIIAFAHVPLWEVYPQWGWGTQDGATALGFLKRFGSVSVLNGHIHQIVQKVEGKLASTRPCQQRFRYLHLEPLPKPVQ